MKEIAIQTPLKNNVIKSLKVGTIVKIKGLLVTARDASLKRFRNDLEKNKKKPNIIGQTNIIYFCGPSPTPRGKIIGSCGPTTTARMEEYFQMLIKVGIKGIIGKGPISKEAVALLKKNNVVYFIATGGAAAYLSTFIKAKDVIAYKDLGAESILKLEVDQFPCITAVVKGNSLFKLNP